MEMPPGPTTENYTNPFFVSRFTIEWGGVGLYLIGLGDPRRGLFSHERGRLSMAAAAADEAPPVVKQRLLAHGVEASTDDSNWAYDLDIYNLENPASVSKYDLLKRRIRVQASTTCQGIVNPTYVKERFGINDLLFVLNLRTGKDTSIPVGFAIIEKRQDEAGYAHLYIDVICALISSRAKSIYERSHGIQFGVNAPPLKPGAGTILLSRIREWAVEQNINYGANYSYIQLTALPYVVAYYERNGYQVPDGAGGVLPRLRFTSNEEFETMSRIGDALTMEPIGTEKEKLQAFARNLREYFEDYTFSANDTDTITAYDEEGKEDAELTEKINSVLSDPAKKEELKQMVQEIRELYRRGLVESEDAGKRVRGLPDVQGITMKLDLEPLTIEAIKAAEAKAAEARARVDESERPTNRPKKNTGGKRQTQRKRKTIGKGGSRKAKAVSKSKATRRHRSARKAMGSKRSKRHTRRR